MLDTQKREVKRNSEFHEDRDTVLFSSIRITNTMPDTSQGLISN